MSIFSKDDVEGTGGYDPFKISSTSTTSRLASHKQMTYAENLLKQRGMPPVDYSKFTSDEIDAEIKFLQTFYPPSKNQLDTIQRLTNELIEMEYSISYLSDEELSTLTGGKSGTAFEYIDFLATKHKQLTDQMPLTEMQASYIASMYYCPDVDFNTYNIEIATIIWLDELYTKKNGQEYYRYMQMSEEQFKDELRARLTKKEAQNFINKYRKTFNEWNGTRIRPRQRKEIRRLEKFLITLTPTYERNIIDIEVEDFPAHSIREIYDPKAYNPYSDHELNQMSKENAKDHIERLRLEIDQKTLYRFEKEGYDDDIHETLTLIDERYQWAYNELKVLSNMLHALQKKSGQMCTDEIHSIPYISEYSMPTHNDPFFKDIKKLKAICEYLYDLVINGEVKYSTLKVMSRKSETASYLVENVKLKLLNNKKYLEKLLT